MKTLKKTLCLVLAVVMVVGVLTIPSMAAFNDSADIKNKTAVEVLNMLGILNGKEDGSNFAPNDTLTRAEAAAIVARATLSTKAEELTSVAQKFTDVATGYWGNKYIAWAYDKGIIAGRGNGAFDPDAKVTGNELAKMLLVTIGVKGVYTGDTWANGVVENARDTKMFAGLDTVDMTAPINRDNAAQMVFNAITWSNTQSINWRVYDLETGVEYYYGPSETIAAAYASRWPHTGTDKVSVDNASLGRSVFGLTSANEREDHGRVNPVWRSTAPKASYTVPHDPSATFYVATPECDIASVLGFDGDVNVTTYLNGVANKVSTPVQSTDTVGRVGAQGRTIEVYPNSDAPKTGELVMFDTYLGIVTGTTSKLTDKAGHVITDATATIEVYVGTKVDPTDSSKRIPDTRTAVISNEDGTYSDGDYLSLHYLSTSNGMVVDDIKIIEPKTVTVAAIGNGATGSTLSYEGIRDTAGTSYRYNCTYSFEKLDWNFLNGQVYLYLDDQNNILAYDTDGLKTLTGLVTAVDAVKIGVASYAAEVEYLAADNTLKVAYVIDSATNNAFRSANDATNTIGAYYDQLVEFEADPTNPDYFYITNVGTPVTGVDEVYAGDPTIDDTDLNVNKYAVFYVANYTTDIKNGGYRSNGYTAIKGFKNINDLFASSGDRIDNGNTITSGALNVSVLGTDAVLVKEAVVVKGNRVHNVDAYAYLLTRDEFVDTYNEFRDYRAIVEGQVTTLRVTAASAGLIADPGLYAYTNAGNYTAILSRNTYLGSTQFIEKGNYSLKAGVLSTKTAGTTLVSAENHDDGTDGTLTTRENKVAVADDVKVFLVNPNTAEIVAADTSYLTNVYASKCDIWYQLNEYGYVDLIYVINYEINPSSGSVVARPAVELLTFRSNGSAFTATAKLSNLDPEKTYTYKLSVWGYLNNNYTDWGVILIDEVKGDLVLDADGIATISSNPLAGNGVGDYSVKIDIYENDVIICNDMEDFGVR